MLSRGETKETITFAVGDVSSAVPSATAAKIVWDVVPLNTATFLSTSAASTFTAGDFHGGLSDVPCPLVTSPL